MMMRKIVAAFALAVAASAGQAAEPLRDLPVSIQVLDASDQPVSGGMAYLDGNAVGKSVRDGWASDIRREVKPGVAIVAYTRPGFAAVRRVRVRETDQSLTATIRLGEEPVAEGQVVASDGTPMPGAEIVVHSNAFWRAIGHFEADQEGRFQLDGYCLDGASVTAQAPGFVRDESQQTIREPFPARIRFTLFREGTVTVKVTDLGGAPIRGAYFDWHQEKAADGRPVGRGMGGIPWPGMNGWGHGSPLPGEVWIRAYAPGYELEVRKVTVGEGQDAGTLEFRLKAPPTVPVSGVVVGPDGLTPISGASVSLAMSLGPLSMAVPQRPICGGYSGYGGTLRYDATTDEEGQFNLRVPRGRYTMVGVGAEGYVQHTGSALEVTGAISSLRIRLRRGGRVEGTVLAPDGSLPPEGTIARCAGRTAQVSPKTGAFLFEHLPAGDAELTVRLAGPYPRGKAEFEVREGEVVRPRLQFPPEARIVGKVVDGRGGQPIAMAVVGAELQSGGDYGQGVTEDDGTFEIPSMAAGRISVRVSMPGMCSVSRMLDASDGGEYEVVLRTSPGGRIEGQVTDALPANPGRAISIALHPSEEDRAPIYPDERGRFVITRVPPGSYALKAQGPDGTHLGEPVEVTVREGETTRVVLEAP